MLTSGLDALPSSSPRPDHRAARRRRRERRLAFVGAATEVPATLTKNIARWPALEGALIDVVEDDEVVRYTFERVLRAAGATVEVAEHA
jgi:hypothetical protein